MGEEIIKVLDNMCSKFGVAIDWTSTNVLPYLQDLVNRFIKYCNGVAIIQIVLFSIGIIVGIVMIKKLRKMDYKKLKDFQKEVYEWNAIVSVILILVGSAFIIGNGIGILKNTYTPEIVVLEQIQQIKEWNS